MPDCSNVGRHQPTSHECKSIWCALILLKITTKNHWKLAGAHKPARFEPRTEITSQLQPAISTTEPEIGESDNEET